MSTRKQVVLGIDIGGTNTDFGLVTREGEILDRGHLDTRQFPTANNFVKGLKREVERVMKAHGEIELKGVGAGVPNANPYTGIIENPPNLPWQGKSNLIEFLETSFEVKALINNDANAAALGEKRYGKGKTYDNFIVITLGTGIGGGIIVDGHLVQGREGLAGEVGHMIAVPDGRLCNCGRKGCFERYASATGLKETIYEMLARPGSNSSLAGLDPRDISSKRIFEAAREGDPLALEAFDYTSQIIGKVLADVAALFSPERILFLGGLANAGTLLLQPAQQYFDKHVLFIHQGKIKLEHSILQDREAAILGSAALIWERLDGGGAMKR